MRALVVTAVGAAVAVLATACASTTPPASTPALTKVAPGPSSTPTAPANTSTAGSGSGTSSSQAIAPSTQLSTQPSTKTKHKAGQHTPTPVTATGPATRPASPTGPTSAPASATTLSADDAIKQAENLVASGEYGAVEPLLAGVTPQTHKQASNVTYWRATARAYAGDDQGAITLEEDREGDASPVERAWLHNCLTWLYWDEGDDAGALVQNTQMGAAVAKLTGDDYKGTVLHYLWDRAYLLLDQALAADPKASGAALAPALQAKMDYEAKAIPAKDHDGMAVLDAWFDARLGNNDAALSDAKKVDLSGDSDVQDWYVLQLAYDAGGDHGDAASIRARIRKDENPYMMPPLIMRQLDRDAAAASAHLATPARPASPASPAPSLSPSH
jgi:hypothetical protein